MAKVKNIPLIREAMELTTPITVHTKTGDVPGDVGDWLMKTPGSSELYIVKRALFERAYKIADAEYEE